MHIHIKQDSEGQGEKHQDTGHGRTGTNRRHRETAHFYYKPSKTLVLYNYSQDTVVSCFIILYVRDYTHAKMNRLLVRDTAAV